MATDFLLAAVAGGLAIPLLRIGRSADSMNAVAWGMAFVFTAAAALVGGLFHGTRDRLTPEASERLWRITLLLSCAIGLFIVAAAAFGDVAGGVRRPLLMVAVVKFVVAVIVAMRTGRFAIVAYDSAVSLLLLGAVVAVGLGMGVGGRGGWWILGGVALSFAGAMLQLRGIRSGRIFDHNDLFHLVQALACYLFYQGAGRG